MRRRDFVLASLAVCIIPVGSARGGAARDFDPKAFQAAQEAGQGIVVQVHATW
jgi:hypothetical protein